VRKLGDLPPPPQVLIRAQIDDMLTGLDHSFTSIEPEFGLR
jgi:hypothetical protein